MNFSFQILKRYPTAGKKEKRKEKPGSNSQITKAFCRLFLTICSEKDTARGRRIKRSGNSLEKQGGLSLDYRKSHLSLVPIAYSHHFQDIETLTV